MKKKILIALIIVFSLTGCFSSKKEFRMSSYSGAYIKDTLHGKFWYIYAILKEKYPVDPADEDCYIVLRQSLDTPGDYVPMFRIPDTDYEYGDIILGDLEYMFLIKNNEIIRYKMKGGKRDEFNTKYKNIEFLGIKQNSVYFQSNNKYYKSDRDFKSIVEVLKEDLPEKYTFKPINN